MQVDYFISYWMTEARRPENQHEELGQICMFENCFGCSLRVFEQLPLYITTVIYIHDNTFLSFSEIISLPRDHIHIQPAANIEARAYISLSSMYL